MNQGALPVTTLSPLLLGVLVASLLGVALLRAPWRALLSRSERQHAFFACLFILPLLWAGTMEVTSGVRLHLMGMTAVLLVFGWELAVVIGALAGAVLVIFGAWHWSHLPVNLSLVVAVPVAITQGLLVVADRLPRSNLFVYLLGVGFLGGALSMTASLVMGARLLAWDLDHAMALLLAFPEGFIDGTVITALTVFYPTIMRTYDDERYLGRP